MGLTPKDELLERQVRDGLPEPLILLLQLLQSLHLVGFQPPHRHQQSDGMRAQSRRPCPYGPLWRERAGAGSSHSRTGSDISKWRDTRHFNLVTT